MTSGVYAIFNLSNGFVYVGSSVNIERCWNGRVWELNRGQASPRPLQADWSAARGGGFEFRILEITTNDNKVLLQAEESWIACLRAVAPGLYNIRNASVGRHGFSMSRRGWSWPYRWKGFRRVRSRKAHYFEARGKVSLCGKEEKVSAHGFEDFNHDSTANCAECMRRYAALPKRRPRPATGSQP